MNKVKRIKECVYKIGIGNMTCSNMFDRHKWLLLFKIYADNDSIRKITNLRGIRLEH